jgi:phosphoribosyl 1,2-cyclic phosphodiesterase
VKVALWGVRGSLPGFGPENLRFGGNTSCVAVEGEDGTLLVLDAGTGIRRLGYSLGRTYRRIDVLLSHLHMDHLQGLGFFGPLFEPDLEVHVWGPATSGMSLAARLGRYISPPLFPVRLREIPARLTCHDVPRGTFGIGALTVTADFVCHPGPTVGYRIEEGRRSLAYLPDHEPALGDPCFPGDPRWTSGYDLAHRVDVLVHDCQYSPEEYGPRVGWGHSTIPDAMYFADMTGAARLVTFHHDPSHDDDTIDRLLAEAADATRPGCDVQPGHEGDRFEV